MDPFHFHLDEFADRKFRPILYLKPVLRARFQGQNFMVKTFKMDLSQTFCVNFMHEFIVVSHAVSAQFFSTFPTNTFYCLAISGHFCQKCKKKQGCVYRSGILV